MITKARCWSRPVQRKNRMCLIEYLLGCYFLDLHSKKEVLQLQW